MNASNKAKLDGMPLDLGVNSITGVKDDSETVYSTAKTIETEDKK